MVFKVMAFFPDPVAAEWYAAGYRVGLFRVSIGTLQGIMRSTFRWRFSLGCVRQMRLNALDLP